MKLIDKLDAEINKLRAEQELIQTQTEIAIQEVKKVKKEITAVPIPLFKQLEFYKTITPIILGLLGLFFTYKTGFFDTKEAEIKNRIALQEIAEYKISKQVAQLRRDSLKLYQNFIRTKDSLNNITTQQIKKYEAKLNTKNNDINELKSKIKTIGHYKDQAKKIKAQEKLLTQITRDYSRAKDQIIYLEEIINAKTKTTDELVSSPNSMEKIAMQYHEIAKNQAKIRKLLSVIKNKQGSESVIDSLLKTN